MPEPLTLASRSPQRRAILEQLEVDFVVAVPAVEELTAGDPEAMVVENARRKARSVAGELVLGVDTTVVLEGQVLGKPADEAQARAFLSALSGKSHEVWSGIALVQDGRERTAAGVTRVRFRSLVGADLDWYLATEEWRGRAGGYAIQARGATLVEAIEGEYLNVVGLPVAELVRLAPQLVRGG
ncbi:MAG: Maf family protein [Actinomycetota bacterium]|nr:Maf family protein [Actinomycetota bacterium]